jgi:hypothetical protein
MARSAAQAEYLSRVAKNVVSAAPQSGALPSYENALRKIWARGGREMLKRG